MTTARRDYELPFLSLNAADPAEQHDIQTENKQALEKDFIPCSKCCPQVNQTVVLVAVAWILISMLLSLVNQWIFHNHVRFALLHRIFCHFLCF